MALQGNLDDFSLPEILQLIAVQQKSGVLKLTSGSDVAVIFFEGGRVVSTRDRRRNAKDPLKVFLVQTGYLTDAQLKQIETIESESKRELTDVLLSGNYLTTENLAVAIQDQIQDTMHQLLTWKQGTYHFSGDGRTVPKFAANVRLNTEGLLMESMRRLDEIVRYKQALSSTAMVLRPKALAVPPKEMSGPEQRVLPLVDGLKPLRDIIAQSKLVEFEVYEALHHLLELGVIEVSLGAAPAPPKVTPIVKETVATPSRSFAIPVAVVLLAASFGIGRFATPALYAQAERSVRHAPDPGVTLDESQRLSLALEIYRSIRGSYPSELRALSREGVVPASTVSAFVHRFDYQSDGTSYHKSPRPTP
ncbi:MAG TPA: DUF4388 domain-containing protein [Candidatus Saccharimonadales bacterium]|nr:DUF4388 domain-containing protein [Candidatus Saccharimonadales bacterium]